MKAIRLYLFLAASLLFADPSYAQWQTQNHSVPIGKGAGVTGFGNAPPAAAGTILTSNGPSADPSFQPNPTVGTVTSITSQAGVKSSPNPIVNTGTISADGNYTGFALSNCSLQATVVSNTLTVALKDHAGADPTVSSPCNINYRDALQTTGSTASVPQTSALSINTFAVGATLGSSNSVPFRFWVVIFNNAGTNVLGLINCSNSAAVVPLNEGAVANSVPISGAATSAAVIYTPNGITVVAKPFRILGYLEYTSGLVTAGSYSSLPTALQVFGPGTKKPGDVVQLASFSSTTATSVVPGGTTATALSTGLSLTSSMNLVRIRAFGSVATPTIVAAPVTVQCVTQIVRNSSIVVSNSGGFLFTLTPTGVNMGYSAQSVMEGIDLPSTSATVTYTVFMSAAGAICGWLFPGSIGNRGFIEAEEIMG